MDADATYTEPPCCQRLKRRCTLLVLWLYGAVSMFSPLILLILCLDEGNCWRYIHGIHFILIATAVSFTIQSALALYGVYKKKPWYLHPCIIVFFAVIAILSFLTTYATVSPSLPKDFELALIYIATHGLVSETLITYYYQMVDEKVTSNENTIVVIPATPMEVPAYSTSNGGSSYPPAVPVNPPMFR